MPFVDEVGVTTVEFEDADDVDDTDEEEFERWIVLRGRNMPLTSSGFIEFMVCVPLPTHAGRLICGKVGGLATAVMRGR